MFVVYGIPFEDEETAILARKVSSIKGSRPPFRNNDKAAVLTRPAQTGKRQPCSKASPACVDAHSGAADFFVHVPIRFLRCFADPGDRMVSQHWQ